MVQQVCEEKQDKQPPLAIQQVIQEFVNLFVEPTLLPPHRDYDHTIPLVPGSVAVNARPYIYSSQHKDGIVKQVKSLLSNGFITLVLAHLHHMSY
jgi:hypothetical protein